MSNIFIQISLCFFAVLCQANRVSAQKLNYDIYRGDSKIGTIDATRNADGAHEEFNVIADVTFRVVFKYNRQTKLEVSYQEDRLNASTSKTVMNEELKELSKLEQTGNHYKCFKHPDESFELQSPIHFTAVKLYFEEPVGIDKVFSESFLAYCDLQNMGDHRYKLTLPGKRVNYYTYKDNKLVHVTIDRTWFDLTFRINK